MKIKLMDENKKSIKLKINDIESACKLVSILAENGYFVKIEEREYFNYNWKKDYYVIINL